MELSKSLVAMYLCQAVIYHTIKPQAETKPQSGITKKSS